MCEEFKDIQFIQTSLQQSVHAFKRRLSVKEKMFKISSHGTESQYTSCFSYLSDVQSIVDCVFKWAHFNFTDKLFLKKYK